MEKLKRIVHREKFQKYLFPSLLLIFFITISLSAALTKSATSDESSHLIRGRILLDTGDYRINQHNPALINVIQALPTYLNPNIKIETLDENNQKWQEADKDELKENWVVINGGRKEFRDEVLKGPRILMTVLLTAFGFAFYQLIRKQFGFSVAAITLSLFALSPTFIAHSPLLATGAIDAVMIFLATWSLYLFTKSNPDKRKRDFIIFLAISFISLNTKYTAVMVSAIWLLVLFIDSFTRSEYQNIVKKAFTSLKLPLVSIATWFIGLFLIYGGEFATLEDMTYASAEKKQTNISSLQNIANKIDSLPLIDNSWSTIEWAYKNLKLPFPQYINGFLENVIFHNMEWYGKVFVDWYYPQDHWLPQYFPVTFAVKESSATVILAIASLIFLLLFAATRFTQFKASFAKHYPLWLTAVFLAFLMIMTSINLGIRHLMPLMPFLFLGMGTVFAKFIRNHPKPALTLYITATIFTILSLINAYPNYISYFNELVQGQKYGPRVVRGTNLDWGQNDIIVEEYVNSNNAVQDFAELKPGVNTLVVTVDYTLPPHYNANYRKLYEMWQKGEIKQITTLENTHLVFEVKGEDFIRAD